MDFDSCLQLKAEHVATAIESSEALGELLSALEKIARPNDGAPKILIAIARMATQDCTWMDGELRVEIDGDAKKTTIAVLSELGAGFREAVFPRLKLAVPYEEFVRAVELAPTLYAPLTQAKHPTRIVLVGSAVASSSQPPPSFELAETSLRNSLPPTVRQPEMADAPVVPPLSVDDVPRPKPARKPAIEERPTVTGLAAQTGEPKAARVAAKAELAVTTPPRAQEAGPAGSEKAKPASRPPASSKGAKPTSRPPASSKGAKPTSRPPASDKAREPATRPSDRPTAPPPAAATFEESERPTTPGVVTLPDEPPTKPGQPGIPSLGKISGWEHSKPTLEMPAVKPVEETLKIPEMLPRPTVQRLAAQKGGSSEAERMRAQLVRPTVQKITAQKDSTEAEKMRAQLVRPTVQKIATQKDPAKGDELSRPTVQKLPAQKVPKS